MTIGAGPGDFCLALPEAVGGNPALTRADQAEECATLLGEKMDVPATRRAQGSWPASILLFVLVLLAQFPLILNPGYYSHDELQWAAFADIRVGATFFHGVPWLDFDAFQYRPLTFNLWLWLSHHLFAYPHAFHGLLVAWGTVNAVLLQRLLLAIGCATRPAMFAAFLFALSPYAVFVHGWIGTIGDLVWISCALLIALLAIHDRQWAATAAAACLLTAIALLAKEAALSIPALAVVACWVDRRHSSWRAILAGSGIAALLYLGLRYEALLLAPAHGNLYDWRLAHVPLRWLEYQLFPPSVSVIEVLNTAAGGFTQSHVLAAAVLWLGLVAALSQIGWRSAVVFLVGGFAALGPALVLGASSNQYAYGFIAFSCGAVAVAWSRLRRWGKVLVLVYGVLLSWHGVNVMRLMHHVGTVQARFSPALAAAVGTATETAPLRLMLAQGSEEWLFLRLSHDIPAYHGIAIGKRVRIVAANENADYTIEPDGRLKSVRISLDP